MPKRISKKLKDPNQIASSIVALSTQESERDTGLFSQVMAAMGRKGGKIGGKRSLETMSSVDRKKRAKKAAKARWRKQVPKPD
jgi:hypothetical protein